VEQTRGGEPGMSDHGEHAGQGYGDDHDHGDGPRGPGGLLRARGHIGALKRSLRGLLLGFLGIDIVKDPPPHPDHDGEGLPPGIELADHRFGGGYLYKARQLLVTRDDFNLVLRLLQEGRIRLAPGEPQPIGGAGLLRVFLHPDEPKPVPEVISILRAVDLPNRPPPGASPVHVVPAVSHPRGYPCDSPRAVGPLDPPPVDDDGQPGAGVRVAVLDSGVVEGHPWLGTRVEWLSANDVEQPQLQNGELNRFSGHGTFIAGVVLQCAPGATVVAKKVFNPIGFVDDTELAAALNALPANIQVINLSLGGPTHDNMGLPATEAALLLLSQQNPRPVVVAAAGNEGATTPTFPAAFKDVIAVGAQQAPGGGRACFSNHGSWVDACAMGRRVHSTFFEDLDATPEPISQTCLADPPPGFQQFQGFATWSGTSFAAPCVAGAIAARMTDQNIGAVQAAFQLVDDDGQPQHPDGDLGTIVSCAGGVD
jgi:subtilisin family serine protease